MYNEPQKDKSTRENKMKNQISDIERGLQALFNPKSAPKPVQIERAATAHIVVAGSPVWGGRLVEVDYKHHNCSLFEAELEVNKILRSRKLTLHAVLKKEVCAHQGKWSEFK